jgi:hypothetical protein
MVYSRSGKDISLVRKRISLSGNAIPTRPAALAAGTSPAGTLVLVSSPRKGNPPMIASEVQQRIDQLSDQLQNIRGYL